MKNNKFKFGRTIKDLLKENERKGSGDFAQVKEIDMKKIYPISSQPRTVFNEDKIEELALSVKNHGLIQPIILKEFEEGYKIVSGERRFRAFQRLNKKNIPAIIKQYREDSIPELSLIENIQREALSPIEEAKALKYILDNKRYKVHELGLKIGKSRSHIINTIGLLNLPIEVINYLNDKSISMAHARVLSKLKDNNRIIKLANTIIKNNLSVRDLERKVSKNKALKKTLKSRFPEEEKYLNSKYNVLSRVKKESIVIKGTKKSIENIIKKLKS
jgi:ParB family chromosome partitioning protein